MDHEASSLSSWTPEAVALGRRWVQAWREAGEAMERLHREELRRLDGYKAIPLLCGPADYHVPPRCAAAHFGIGRATALVQKAAGRDWDHSRRRGDPSAVRIRALAILLHRRSGLATLGGAAQTIDVDLTILTGFGDEAPLVRKLLAHYEPRIPDALEFAIARRVVLARAPSGVGLDIALGGLPFEESAVARSSFFAFPPQTQLRTCSAEDLIVMKAFAARAKDWMDVEGIIIRQADIKLGVCL